MIARSPLLTQAKNRGTTANHKIGPAPLEVYKDPDMDRMNETVELKKLLWVSCARYGFELGSHGFFWGFIFIERLWRMIQYGEIFGQIRGLNIKLTHSNHRVNWMKRKMNKIPTGITLVSSLKSNWDFPLFSVQVNLYYYSFIIHLRILNSTKSL